MSQTSVGAGIFSSILGGLLGMGKITPASKEKIVRKINYLHKVKRVPKAQIESSRRRTAGAGRYATAVIRGPKLK